MRKLTCGRICCFDALPIWNYPMFEPDVLIGYNRINRYFRCDDSRIVKWDGADYYIKRDGQINRKNTWINNVLRKLILQSLFQLFY